MEPGVADAADHLVAVVLLGQDPQAGLDHAAPESEHQVEGRLLLDVVVRQSPETENLEISFSFPPNIPINN